MPELPEVETIRRQILPHLPAKVEETLYSDVSDSIVKTREFDPTGKTIVTIERKGKVMDFIFDDGTHLISGLGMSGSWRYSNEPITEKHTHIQFVCSNSEGDIFLAYVDPRRFGKSHFLKESGAREKLDSLGVDISSDEFTGRYIKELCERFPNKIVKVFLLDQKYFAGVGNYIACEMLAHARILPTRKMSTLSLKECNALVKGAKLVLSGSLKKRGLTFSGGYSDATGEKGDALDNLVVFHQEICGLCEKSKVEKIVLGQRGTYYCPKCQK